MSPPAPTPSKQKPLSSSDGRTTRATLAATFPDKPTRLCASIDSAVPPKGAPDANKVVAPEPQPKPSHIASEAALTRISFSSIYSVGSAILSTAKVIAASGSNSIAGSEPESRMEPSLASSPNPASAIASPVSLHPNSSAEHVVSTSAPVPEKGTLHISPSSQSLQLRAPSSMMLAPGTRSRSRTRGQKVPSGSNVTNSASPGSDRPYTRDGVDRRKPLYGVIGVCALDNKARSKPSRNILNRLIANGDFDVIIFGDKIILDEEVENWPVCDYLISFFSDGFPLEKAIAYERLRKPFCVNDLPMQMVLWDRRLCLRILDSMDVPTPKRIEVNRDGGPKLSNPDVGLSLYERTGVKLQGFDDGKGGNAPPPKKVELIEDGDVLSVDGVHLKKPFVEKPVSGEDHNIYIYYPKCLGGGGRRLFRKVDNKSSEHDDALNVPRALTDPHSSFIYEQFLRVDSAEDVKAYTVGPSFCHAETRKSPVVDGLVRRNPNGKEVRYVTSLSKEEADMAARIVDAFGQRVCGFDLLRAGGRSFVIDVNGWSFVKDNIEYYDKCAKILKDLFVQEKQRHEGRSSSSIDTDEISEKHRPIGSGGHRATLRSLFHSPSASKLTGHHVSQHLLRHGHGSPDSGATTSSADKMSGQVASTSNTLPPLPLGDQVIYTSKFVPTLSPSQRSPIPPPASKAQWKLKGVISVIRHADRTPKQKFKFTFHTKPFVNLLKGHQEEVLLIGEPALNEVLTAVEIALSEGVEDPAKLDLLRTSLIKKGSWAGTKVQIKPMFRSRTVEKAPRALGYKSVSQAEETDKANALAVDDENGRGSQDDASSGITLSRISAAENNLILDKLQLIVKWGGEPTHSARYQAQDLGENLRNDLLLMNREALDDVAIYSSSERRVTTSAQIFASAFLKQNDLSSEFIVVRKDLLDDSNAAKDEMDKVKKKLKQLLREGDAAPPQFAWPSNTPEPYMVVRRVVELMKFHRDVMHKNFQNIRSQGENDGTAKPKSTVSVSDPTEIGSSTVGMALQPTTTDSVQSRWCCGEDADQLRERWEKLFKEFCDSEKVDPSKLSELYDTMKFDALHNRQFLEWAFTPEQQIQEKDNVVPNTYSCSDTVAPKLPMPSPVKHSPDPKDRDEANEKYARDRPNLAQRMGFRRRSEAVQTAEPPPETYFNLYGSNKGACDLKYETRLSRLREMYNLSKVLFDYIGPQEYGISGDEKLSIGLLTSLPLLKEIVKNLEILQASDGARSFFYFTKESHIYTLLNCILEGGVRTKIERKNIPELDYLSQINFELYESQNEELDRDRDFNYSIRITLSPGCHTFDPFNVELDSKHCIGCAPRRSLTAHNDWQEILETLRAKFHTVKLPRSFIAVNLSETSPTSVEQPEQSDADVKCQRLDKCKELGE